MKTRWLRTLFIALFTLLNLTVYSQKTITWKKGMLKWKYFQEIDDDEGLFKANLSYVAREVIDTLGNKIRIDFTLIMDQGLSWVKEGHRTDNLRKHEQTHFDIAELELRKIKQLMYNNPNLISSYDSLIKVAEIFEDVVQKSFDRQTLYGSDRKKNREWLRKIRRELRKHRKFSGALIVSRKENDED